jgi:hypothetical protein
MLFEHTSFSDFLRDGLLEKDNRKTIVDTVGLPQFVADWAHELSPKYSIWISNSFKSVLEEGGDDVRDLNDSTIRRKMLEIQGRYIYVLDWLRAPDREEKVDFKRLSLDDAYEMSEEWHKDRSIGGSVEDGDGEVFLEFEDGYYWIDLKATFCDAEAKAMGHCGRTTKGTTLLSLRDRHKEPHVTVAYNATSKFITQIKGKTNGKPAEKYHEHIVDLLNNDIDGYEIEGFALEYRTGDDFVLDDLEPELRDKVEKDLIENGSMFEMLYKRYKDKKLTDDQFAKELQSYWPEITSVQGDYLLVQYDARESIQQTIDDALKEAPKELNVPSYLTKVWKSIITDDADAIEIEDIGIDPETLTEIEDVIARTNGTNWRTLRRALDGRSYHKGSSDIQTVNKATPDHELERLINDNEAFRDIKSLYQRAIVAAHSIVTVPEHVVTAIILHAFEMVFGSGEMKDGDFYIKIYIPEIDVYDGEYSEYGGFFAMYPSIESYLDHTFFENDRDLATDDPEGFKELVDMLKIAVDPTLAKKGDVADDLFGGKTSMPKHVSELETLDAEWINNELSELISTEL